MRTSQAARRGGTQCRSSASTSAPLCRPSGTLAARLASGAAPARPCRGCEGSGFGERQFSLVSYVSAAPLSAALWLPRKDPW